MTHHTAVRAGTAAETGSPDLGYHWIWTWGHLIPAGVFGAIAVVLALVGVPWWGWAPLALVTLWGAAGFAVMRFGVRMNEIPRLPAPAFLPGGSGTVLDVGCGSGRMSISVARARLQARLMGLDNFSAGYIRGHGQANTERNFRLAGIADRASVHEGDMREMPFEAASFDAAVSSAAIDHLEPEDIRKTLSEVQRVVAPGGQFLLMVIVPNGWLTIAFGPMIRHMRGRTFWREALAAAGFTLEQEGTALTTAWFLARKPSA